MSYDIPGLREQIRLLEMDVEDARRGAMRYLSTFNEGITLARRMGLPENVSDQAREIQRLITVVYALVAAYRALQTARMAAGDPIAWIQFGVEAGTAAFGIGATLYNATRGY